MECVQTQRFNWSWDGCCIFWWKSPSWAQQLSSLFKRFIQEDSGPFLISFLPKCMVAPGNFLKYRFKDSFLRVSPLNANFFQWLSYFQEWDGCFYIALPTFISDFLRIVLKVWLKKCMKLWFKDSFVRVWPVCANEGAVATWDKSSQHQNCENLFSSGHKISCEIHQAICSGWPKGFRVSKLTCTNNF